MLVIDSTLVEAMVAHARSEHPIEACGVIAGPERTDRPARAIPLRNAAGATGGFAFDSRQQLAVWREMGERSEEPVVIYHSHTSSPAYPSRDDVLNATVPHAHYVIVATGSSYEETVRSFRIANGKVAEERVCLAPTAALQA